MPNLSGVVDLDYKDGLTGLKIWRRELHAATKDPTVFRVIPDYDGAKIIRRVTNDFKTLTKIGKEHSVTVTATAKGDQAIKTLGSVRTELSELGRNPRVIITIDDKSARQTLRGTKTETKALEKEVSEFGKALVDDVARTTKSSASAATSETKKLLADSEKAFAKAAKADADGVNAVTNKRKADAEAIRKQKELGASWAREIEAGYRRNGVTINRYGEEVKTVTGYLKQLTDEERKAQAAAKKRSDEMKDARSELRDKASTGATVVGVGILAGLGYATKAAIDFEDQFADVRKTVAGTDADLDQLGEAILKMSGTLPVAASELNQIASGAGQLGLTGTANILQFTKVVANLKTVTGMASEELGSGLAKLGNITQMNQRDYDRLGSTFAKLGNIGASTGQQILDMGLRIAGAGHQVGMNEPEILGVANALASLGIEAESGGSSFSRALIEISKSTAEGGKTLTNFAHVAGMSVGDFKRLFDRDATEAVTRFIEGLGKLKKGEIFQVLDALGLKSIRITDTMNRASGAGDLLRQSVKEGSKAWQENTFLQEKAEARNKTHANQIKTAANRVNELAIGVGNKLLPVEEKLLGVVDRAIDTWNGLSDGTQTQIVRFTTIAGVSLVVVGRLNDVAKTVGLLKIAYQGLAVAEGEAGAAGAASAARVGVSWGALARGGGVLALVAVAIAGITTAFYGAQDAGTMSADRLRERWSWMGTFWDNASSDLNTFASWLDRIAQNPVLDKLTSFGSLGQTNILRGLFSTEDVAGDAAQSKALGITAFNKWKRDHAVGPAFYVRPGLSAKNDPQGDPADYRPPSLPRLPSYPLDFSGSSKRKGRKKKSPKNFGFPSKSLVATPPRIKQVKPFVVPDASISGLMGSGYTLRNLLDTQPSQEVQAAIANLKREGAVLGAVKDELGKEEQKVAAYLNGPKFAADLGKAMIPLSEKGAIATRLMAEAKVKDDKAAFAAGFKKQQKEGLSAEKSLTAEYARRQKAASEAAKKRQDEIDDTTESMGKLNREYENNLTLAQQSANIRAYYGPDETGAERGIDRLQASMDLMGRSDIQTSRERENKGLFPKGYTDSQIDAMMSQYDQSSALKYSVADTKEANRLFEESIKDATEAYGSSWKDLGEWNKKVQDALDDTNGKASDLRDLLGEIPDSLRALTALAPMAQGTDELSQSVKKLADNLQKAKDAIPTRTQAELFADSPLLQDAMSHRADLERQLSLNRASMRRPLSALQQQEWDWNYQDSLEASKPDYKAPTADLAAKIKEQRDAVRSLMRDMEGMGKFERFEDRFVDSFDRAFDSVLTREKSFLGAAGDMLGSALNDWARQVLQSQLRSGLMSLFGGAFGGSSKNLALTKPNLDVSNSPIPSMSLAVGIDDVPRDLVAQLHSREMVLDRFKAEEYRRQRASKLMAMSPSGGGSSGGNMTVQYIHYGDVVTNDPADYQRQQQEMARRNGPKRSRFENSRSLASAGAEAKF